MCLIDIGANLTHGDFRCDLENVLAEATQAGVHQIIVTGTSVQDSHAAVALADAHVGQLFATVGIHPHNAAETNADVIGQLRFLAHRDQVKAIGETGLDYFRDFTPRDIQRDALHQHLNLAADTGLPVFLHERDAADDVISILTSCRSQLSDVVVHCFTGNDQALRAYLSLDMYIGITGWICDERRGQALRSLVKHIPDNRLMIETDAPYLMPRSLKPKPKSRRNAPKHLAHICEFVAHCRGQSATHLAHVTSNNAKRFFRL